VPLLAHDKTIIARIWTYVRDGDQSHTVFAGSVAARGKSWIFSNRVEPEVRQSLAVLAHVNLQALLHRRNG
jgi:hypothetical protein